MSRTKTYLSPEQQCRKTLELAIEWVEGFRPLFCVRPDYYENLFLWCDTWNETKRKAQALIDGRSNKRFAGSYSQTLNFIWFDETFVFGDTWKIGITRRNTRHFLKGDLVLVTFTNGMDRHPVWSVTSKGKELVNYYVETNRLGGDFGLIDLIGCPKDLIGKPLTDLAALDVLLSIRAKNRPPMIKYV